MKPVKSFDEFRKELNESRDMNEGVISAIKDALKKIGEFFTGAGSFFMNMLVKQGKKELPKGIRVFPSKSDIDLAKKHGVTLSVPSVKESEEIEAVDPLNEVRITMEHPDPKIPNVNVNQLKDLLRDNIEAQGKSGLPLLIWGAPGIGKTAILQEIAGEYYGPEAEEDRRLIDYNLMTMAPEDFFLPALMNKGEHGEVTGDTRSTRVPDTLLPLYEIGEKDGDKRVNGADGKGGILFFDELGRCDKRVKDVCLKLVDERKLGNYKLGSKWVIVAAANREGDDDTGTFTFSSAMGGRFQQVNYSPKFADWKQWAGFKRGADGELVVLPEILAFVGFNEDFFHKYDPDEQDSAGKASFIYPSPRQWTRASQGLKNRISRLKGKYPSDDETEQIVAAFVGKPAASAYVGFLKLMKKIDVNEIKAVYANPGKAPGFTGLQIDEKQALMSAVVFYKAKAKLDEKEEDNFTQWLIDIKDAPNAIKAITMLQDLHPELKSDDHWNDICKAKFFDAYPKLMGGR